MRINLLPQKGNFYKANLHSHTTVSDGRKTPEEVKDIYKNMGYSIVAYTDHQIMVEHNELTDDTFLALSGVEIDVAEVDKKIWKTCHMCFISPEADVPPQPCIHREKYLYGGVKENFKYVKINEDEPNYERVYSAEGINDVVKRFKEKGFFAVYNHPSWSLETYNEYINYEGFDAMEIMNGDCISAGFEDYNPRVYQDMLMSGKKLFCIGADDNHNVHPDLSRRSDSGWAYTMVKADELTYESIFKALKNGNFYASEGPEIYELFYDCGSVFVSCSGVDRINCNYGVRMAETVLSEKDGMVYNAVFSLPDDCVFFRITLIDKSGKHAYTNAYFVEDIVK